MPTQKILSEHLSYSLLKLDQTEIILEWGIYKIQTLPAFVLLVSGTFYYNTYST